jgi:hypothetical protein
VREIKSISVVPKQDFIRNHNPGCKNHYKGHFENKDEVFWFCYDDSNPKGTDKGKVYVANPSKGGNRRLVDFKEVPTKDDFLFLLPLVKRREVIIVAKSSVAGKFSIYTKDKKLDKDLDTTGNSIISAANLKGFVTPTGATVAKKDEIYFFSDNTKDGTKIHQYNLVSGTTTTVDLKDLSGNNENDLKTLQKVMHVSVTENYITFTGIFNDTKEDYIQFIIFKADKDATNQIQKKESFLTFRELRQDATQRKIDSNALAWMVKETEENASVFVYIKTPTTANTRPYMVVGSVYKSKVVNNSDKLYNVDVGSSADDP